MAANKSKKQFQGKNRRFRGDVWLDEKVSARTMYALQERGVKFPPGTNVRGTREFKDEFKRQLNKFKQEHAAKIAAKKKPQRQRRQQPSSPQPKKLLRYKWVYDLLGNGFV